MSTYMLVQYVQNGVQAGTRVARRAGLVERAPTDVDSQLVPEEEVRQVRGRGGQHLLEQQYDAFLGLPDRRAVLVVAPLLRFQAFHKAVSVKEFGYIKQEYRTNIKGSCHIFMYCVMLLLS